MENSNFNSDSESFWCTFNHSPDKDKDKDKDREKEKDRDRGKDTVFDVSSTCGCASSSKSKSKALVLYDDVATAAASSSNCHRHRNPRKRRSKLISFVNETTARADNDRFPQGSNSSSKYNAHLKRKYVSKKPDPNAPKITRPCSECGKKFWSWKALFGHMRCHPERQWRGINPPPNFRRQQSQTECYAHPFQDDGDADTMFTHDEHEVAACLLLLANIDDEGHVVKAEANIPQDETTHNHTYDMKVLNCEGLAGNAIHASTVPAEEEGASIGFSCGRFECSSCKKVFGSHQALGGHRASHKNVKGCFAITRSVPTSEDVDYVGAHHDLQDCQTQINHSHDNYTSNVGGDYHCNQTEQSQSTTSVLLQEEETLEGKDSTTNASTDSKTAIALGNGHKCSICWRVFSSGQALGGHKRCHWEKADNEALSVSQGITSPLAVAVEPSGAALRLKEQSNVNGTDHNKKDLDLNLPAPLEDDSSSSYSSPLTLDLRLGI